LIFRACQARAFGIDERREGAILAGVTGIFIKKTITAMRIMTTNSRFSSAAGGIMCFAILSGSLPVFADQFLIESRGGGQNTNWYSDGSFANSSLKSSAPGVTAGIGARYGFSSSCTVMLNPTVAVAGGQYSLQVTHGSASSVASDIMVNIAISGGVFTNTSTGTASASIWTTAFQQTPANAWNSAGLIQLDSGATSFTLTCTTTNTDLNSSTNRFYSDAYRFTYTGEPCLQGLAELNVIDGPLYAGQTNVTVPGVAAGATNVNVYANGTLIGSLHHGVAAGVNTVTTSPLVKGQLITATQTGTNGVESCDSAQGTSVGGGANPQIRVSLSLETDPALTGPIGAAGTSASGDYFFLGATGNAGLGGFGTAPAGGQVIYPSTNWQNVSFDPTSDSGYYWAGAYSLSTSLQTGSGFGQLDAIAFCLDDLTDTGPFAIYIDDIMNGTNVIQNFESIPAGTTGAQFSVPSASTTTSVDLLAQAPGTINPNISVVRSVTATSGTNACYANWQFNSLADVNWLRFSFGGTAGGATAYPQVDLTQPISFNLLLLPVGTNVAEPTNPVTLYLSASGSQMTLNWVGSYYLQTTTNLSAKAWTDVGVTAAPYSASMTNPTSLFFRLSENP
jgi:hypothetical protein